MAAFMYTTILIGARPHTRFLFGAIKLVKYIVKHREIGGGKIKK